jgi:hypothetical protein
LRGWARVLVPVEPLDAQLGSRLPRRVPEVNMILQG